MAEIHSEQIPFQNFRPRVTLFHIICLPWAYERLVFQYTTMIHGSNVLHLIHRYLNIIF